MDAKPNFLAVLTFAAFIGIISFCQNVNADEREPSSAGEAGEKAIYFNCNQELEYLKSSAEEKNKGEGEKPDNSGTKYIRQEGFSCFPTSTVNAKIDVYRLNQEQADKLHKEELICLLRNGFYALYKNGAFNVPIIPPLPPNPTMNDGWIHHAWQGNAVKECNEKAVFAVLGKRPKIDPFNFWSPAWFDSNWGFFDSMFWQKGGCEWLREELRKNNGVVLTLKGPKGGHAVQLLDVFCGNGEAVLEIRDPTFPTKIIKIKVGKKDGYIVGSGGNEDVDLYSGPDALGGPIAVGWPYVISAGPS